MTKIFDHFASKTDIDSKIMSCNILVSADNYDDARQQISAIRSLGTIEATNCANVFEMYVNSMDTLMKKEILKEHRVQLENYIADNNYLYSGIATTLYEYAFDTILPEYTPLYEEEISAKNTKIESCTETSPYIIYPNPTNDYINIELAEYTPDDGIIKFLEHYGMQDIEDCENVTVSILDINGRMLQTQEFNYEEEITLNIGDYVPGAYLVEIRSCFSDVFSTKIIKM